MTSMHYVSGDDWDRGLPTVPQPYRRRNRPTGLVWPTAVIEEPPVQQAAPKEKPRKPQGKGVGRGERQRKLSPETWERIVQRYLDGESSEQLATEYDVAAATVAYHVRSAGHQTRSRSEAGSLYYQRRVNG